MKLLPVLFVAWLACLFVTFNSCNKAIEDAGGVENVIVSMGKDVKHIEERIADDEE